MAISSLKEHLFNTYLDQQQLHRTAIVKQFINNNNLTIAKENYGE